MAETDWFTKAEKAGIVFGVVPFRYFFGWEGRRMLWMSWFANPHHELQRFEMEPELASDDWSLPEGELLINWLNGNEERDYRTRIKSLSLAELRKQRDLWSDLQIRSPMRTQNLGLNLTYPPLTHLKDEIQERIADEVQRANLPSAVVAKKRKETQKRLWRKTKSEFCYYIFEQYEKHPGKYRSKRDAVMKIFARFRFSKKWTASQCYALLRQNSRGVVVKEQ